MIPHVARIGSGPERILAVHCSLAHSGMWTWFAEEMTGIAEVTALDLPGHGRSPDWQPGTDQHRLSTDWALSALDSPMHVVGHSYGATVALRVACEASERVLSLTLVEPVLLAAARADEPDRVEAHEAELMLYAEALSRGDAEGAAQMFNQLWGDGVAWEEIPAATRQYMIDRIHFVAGSEPFVMGTRAGLLEPGVLDRIACPSVLVQGERALDVIDATHAALARRIKGVRRSTIRGAGHMAPITHPEALADIVQDIMEEAVPEPPRRETAAVPEAPAPEALPEPVSDPTPPEPISVDAPRSAAPDFAHSIITTEDGFFCKPTLMLTAPALNTAVHGEPVEHSTIRFMARIARAGGDAVVGTTGAGFMLPALSEALAADAIIHAFEPDETDFRAVEYTLALNAIQNVILHDLTVGDGDTGPALPIEDPEDAEVPEDDIDIDIDDAATLTRLDDLVPDGRRVGLMYLDVQRREVAALAGASRLINSYAPVLVIKAPKRWMRRALELYLTEQHESLKYVSCGMLDGNAVYKSLEPPLS